MFPTGVGMNHSTSKNIIDTAYVPHRRGDEPHLRTGKSRWRGMFPTGVGMNRIQRHKISLLYNVPHRRGDEPHAKSELRDIILCSPQAWG